MADYVPSNFRDIYSRMTPSQQREYNDIWRQINEAQTSINRQENTLRGRASSFLNLPGSASNLRNLVNSLNQRRASMERAVPPAPRVTVPVATPADQPVQLDQRGQEFTQDISREEYNNQPIVQSNTSNDIRNTTTRGTVDQQREESTRSIQSEAQIPSLEVIAGWVRDEDLNQLRHWKTRITNSLHQDQRFIQLNTEGLTIQDISGRLGRLTGDDEKLVEALAVINTGINDIEKKRTETARNQVGLTTVQSTEALYNKLKTLWNDFYNKGISFDPRQPEIFTNSMKMFNDFMNSLTNNQKAEIRTYGRQGNPMRCVIDFFS